VQVGSDTNWDSVATSVYYTALSTADQVAIFRKTDGTIYSAGDGGSFGTDGRGGFALPARSSPVQIGAGDTWNAIFGRYSPALFVINSSGVVHKWGVGSTGAIGERPYTTSPTSTETYNWNKVTTYGEFVGAGIKNDGTLWTMGSNTSGGIGQNSDLSYSSPVQVGSATDWSDVASGFRLGLAVKTGGTLWSWGTNATGALGQNVANTLNRSSPVQVGALTNWSKVYAGGTDTSQAVAAIKTDGTLWTWGAGANGFTGLNIAANRSSPVQVGALTNWSKVSVAAGGNHMLAIKTDGTLWAWGLNGNGQLGQNNIIARSSPVQIGALTTWTSAAAGPTFSAAVRSDGTLWVWGLGTNGISGNSNAVTRSSPVQVGVGTDWSSVYTLTTAALGAVKTNGTLWAWGANTTADLGDGTLISRSSPVQIGSLTPWREVVNTGANNPGAIYQ
jgi:alpha-tubulin suppressor-like RCC1 family protein